MPTTKYDIWRSVVCYLCLANASAVYRLFISSVGQYRSLAPLFSHVDDCCWKLEYWTHGVFNTPALVPSFEMLYRFVKQCIELYCTLLIYFSHFSSFNLTMMRLWKSYPDDIFWIFCGTFSHSSTNKPPFKSLYTLKQISPKWR